MIETHGMNAGDAEAAVRDVEDVAELRKTLEHERAHPKYEGGRKQVKDAIEERIGELATSQPLEPVTTRGLRAGGSYVDGELIERTEPRRAPSGEGES